MYFERQHVRKSETTPSVSACPKILVKYWPGNIDPAHMRPFYSYDHVSGSKSNALLIYLLAITYPNAERLGIAVRFADRRRGRLLHRENGIPLATVSTKTPAATGGIIDGAESAGSTLRRGVPPKGVVTATGPRYMGTSEAGSAAAPASFNLVVNMDRSA
jgi:hypothetical protein